MDVYSEWVDACDEVANPKEKTGRSSGAARASQQSRGRYDGGEDDDDDLGGGYGINERSRQVAAGNDDDDLGDDF